MRYIICFFLLISSSVSVSDIFFQDPTSNSLNDAYKKLDSDDFVNIESSNDAKLLLMAGILYLRGDDEFDIKKNCDKALDLLSKSSDLGTVDADYSLSMMYYGGLCVKKDTYKAKELLNKSAEAGYLLSQRMLGRAYWGCSWCDLKDIYNRDMEKAVYWMSLSGEAGDRQSAGSLSYIYEKGKGVEKDEKKAFYWLKKYVHSPKYYYGRLGLPTSLGEFYEKGIGTEKDLVQAYKYYDLGGTSGADDKKRIAPQMTQEQIDEALRLSREWQEEHNVQVGGGWIQFN